MSYVNVFPDRFLARYWQKQPLYLQGFLPDLHPVLSPDELAWLAMQADVESRLVFTESDGVETTYRLEQGPFSESKLGALPGEGWTLLVQDVEKHLPDFRALFAAVHFIPDWRIDDLMISFAAEGGSVGPHLDNYDVFLVQGQGVREWRLGDRDDVRPDDRSAALSLLRPYVAAETHRSGPGDLLYLPPGLPHWGIAHDACMTYSIGMRAPTRAELNAGAARILDMVDENDPEGPSVFYTDRDLSLAESAPGRIDAAAVRRVKEQKLLNRALNEEQMALVLGSVVTDPKAWLMPEPASRVPDDLRVHGMARLAWYEQGAVRLVFANGVAREVTPSELSQVRALCRDRHLDPVNCATLAGTDLAEWLRIQGTFDQGFGAE